MERRPDDLFRVHDLSVLKSPMPAHLAGARRPPAAGPAPAAAASGAAHPHPPPLRPTPTLHAVPFGLSALTARIAGNAASSWEAVGAARVAPSPLGVPIAPMFELSAVDQQVAAALAEQDAAPSALSSVAALAEPSTEDDSSLPSVPFVLGAQPCSTPVRDDPAAADSPPRRQPRRTTPSLARAGGRAENAGVAKDFDLGGLAAAQQTAGAENIVFDANMDGPDAAGLSLGAAGPAPKESSAAEGAKGRPASSEIVLSQWSMVMVPNNPETTKISAACRDWIVLVGRREDIAEMWHSSLITSRLSGREITTGSGRVYRLKGPLDEPSLAEHGFSPDTAHAFRDGFPPDWRERLQAELSRPPSSARDSESDPKQSRRRSAAPPPIPNPNPNSRRRTEHVSETPVGADARPRRRSDPPPPGQQRTPECSPEVAAQTRSGRRVVRPLAYWENKYMHPGPGSPSSAVLKRKWGNRLEI